MRGLVPLPTYPCGAENTLSHLRNDRAFAFRSPDLDMAYLQNMVQLFVRRQFSVKLAFWLTINRAQGQVFSCIGLLSEDPVFAHGQLYVSLLQASSGRGLQVVVR